MCCYGISGKRVVSKGKKVIGEVFIQSFLLKFAAVFPSEPYFHRESWNDRGLQAG